MKLLGIIRSSNQDVAEGYGPTIQEAELVAYCHTNGHNLVKTERIIERATIDLEDRELFKATIAEAIRLRQSGECDGILFSRCDRLSRQMEGAIQVALDLKKTGLSIVLVRENQTLKANDEPMNFMMFIMQAFGTDTQTRIFLANTQRGQRKAAEDGKLPSGVGGKGLYGYDLIGPRGEKKFQPNSNIWIVDEALALAYKGDSINQVTRSLREKNVAITRDSVHKILSHARVYAGIYHWGGQDIAGLVPARISMIIADKILANMQYNKEHSYGWGKRKWLTGHVRCGVCGGSFALETGKKRCHCRRSNALERLDSPCKAPKVNYHKLDKLIWDLLTEKLSTIEFLANAIAGCKDEWKHNSIKVKRDLTAAESQANRIEDKRKRILSQHAKGYISDSELDNQIKAIKGDIDFWSHRIEQLRTLSASQKDLPIDRESLKRYVEGFRAVFSTFRNKPTDEAKELLARMLNVKVIISPSPKSQFLLHLETDIPLFTSDVAVGSDGVLVSTEKVSPCLPKTLPSMARATSRW